MSEIATLARPYAEAVFKRAKESDATAKWSEMLGFLSAVMQDKEIAAASGNPKISRQRLTALLLDICAGQVNDEGVNFVKLLVQNGRLSLVPHIAKLYEQYKADDEGYVDVDVLTAFSFSDEQQKQIAESLEKTLNKKVHINVAIDKSLIGGVLIRAGDRVIDGSIKGQLQQLAKRL